jgi:acetyltransferase-like isoleucine patch superfamily enzyme
MGVNIFTRFARYSFRLALLRKLTYKFNYSRLNVASSAYLSILGYFEYGHNSSIGGQCNIIVPENASLVIGTLCYIGRQVELAPNKTIMIGSNTSIQDRATILGDVTIGRYCVIAANLYISSGRHYFDIKPSWLIKDQDLFVLSNLNTLEMHSRPVIVEDDVWLGINVVISPGVTIGKGAVIGANSVVTKDVKPYSVVAGVPAKFIKERLEFIPPIAIDQSNSGDWPYFYSGFEIDQASLNKYSAIPVLKDFVICLNGAAGQVIQLDLININTSPLYLSHHGKQILLTAKSQTVEFKIDSSSNFFRFLIESEQLYPLLLIERARIL